MNEPVLLPQAVDREVKFLVKLSLQTRLRISTFFSSGFIHRALNCGIDHHIWVRRINSRKRHERAAPSPEALCDDYVSLGLATGEEHTPDRLRRAERVLS